VSFGYFSTVLSKKIMIGYIKGNITVKTPTYIYVEASGVGYHINISLNSFSKLEGKDQALVFTHMQVREDDMSLWGFLDEEERHLFVQLISVSGIGCNTARVILSYMTVEEVKRAIVNEDEFSLGKVKGIGPKTAKRVIIDLKDKIMKSSGIEPAMATFKNQTSSGGNSHSLREEALAALVALGFPKPAMEKQLSSILSKNLDLNSVEDLIKQVLKQMN
jgi:holliday junction DNA helicase RuvA